MIYRYRIFLLLLATTGPLALMAAGSPSGQPRPAGPRVASQPDRPNIILIYADDIDCESVFAQWPEQSSERIRFPVLRQLAGNGTVFTNFHVTTPVCGPSRACLLSGQYAHRSGYRVNNPDARSANGFSGGYDQFDPDRELGGWMKQAGYETAYVGKYLHEGFAPKGQTPESWKSIRPAGWDHLLCSLGGRYFHFGRVDCEQHDIERINGQYRTDVEAESVAQMLREHRSRSGGKPLFLCWGPFASHLPVDERMVHERHKNLYPDEVPSGVREIGRYQVMADQPLEPGRIPVVSPATREKWTRLHRKRLQAMTALDEGLGRILQTLEETGQRENTLIIFTSDHGYMLGQHRHFGKRMPRDRVSRVPMIVWGPGVPANRYCDQLLANIDLAPTLVEVASGAAPADIDGISFAPLLTRPDQAFDAGRPGILIENWDQAASNGQHVNFTYCSLRTANHLYTEWASGDREYFDLRSDPEQVNNLYQSLDKSEKNRLAGTMRSLHRSPGPPLFSSQVVIPQVYQQTVMSPGFVPVTFSGFVEDDTGIDKVELEFHSTTTDRYWNGQRWRKGPVRVAGKLAIPQGNLSAWSYELDTGEHVFGGHAETGRHNMVVNLIATDIHGNETRLDSALQFRLSVGDPETWLNVPDDWKADDRPLVIRGRAADDTGVARVKVLIQDLDRQRFWNGNQWVAEESYVDASLKNKPNPDPRQRWVRWTYIYDGPPTGSLHVSARSYDTAGNFDDSIPFCDIPNRR